MIRYYQNLYLATTDKLTLAVRSQGALEGALKSIKETLNSTDCNTSTKVKLINDVIDRTLEYSDGNWVRLQNIDTKGEKIE